MNDSKLRRESRRGLVGTVMAAGKWQASMPCAGRLHKDRGSTLLQLCRPFTRAGVCSNSQTQTGSALKPGVGVFSKATTIK